LEQTLSWSLWVRGVGDDDIKGILVVIQELEAISDMYLNLGVLEANRHAREELLREANNGLKGNSAMRGSHGNKLMYLVNVAQYRLLDTVMLDDFTQHTSIATTDDQNLLWVGMGVHRQVGNHLLVWELVSLGTLDDVVKDQDSSVVGGLEDKHILVLALLVMYNLLNLESHSLAGPHLGDLAEPAIWTEKAVSLVEPYLDYSYSRVLRAACVHAILPINLG
jgi:hypothetical protein